MFKNGVKMQRIADADKLKGIIITTVFYNWLKNAIYLDKINFVHTLKYS